jgi:long-subunit fatty acid transport protein
MIRRFLVPFVVLLVTPAALVGQSSIFGTRALGLQILPLSARAQGMAGANAMFDNEVGLNPAAIWITQRPAAGFTLRHFWRDSENPFGTATGNDTQFPLAMVTGPIGRKWDFGFSVSGYADRTFALALTDTLDLRGAPVAVNDTLLSKGGITDIQGAVAYTVNPRLAVGVGLHILTGTNRLEYRRTFEDSSYRPLRIKNELSVSGPGVSAGVSAELTKGVRLAGILRWDGDLAYYKDSTRLQDIPLPMTVAGGIQVQAGPRLLLAGQGLYRNWSTADDFIKSQGGVGSKNSAEASAGFQWLRDARHPSRFPLRAGVRYAKLPFPVVEGQDNREFQLSLGTGFRFQADRGGLDVAVERAWRNDGGDFKERTFMLSVGVGIRP